MTATHLPSSLPADAAMLLVLLPPVGTALPVRAWVQSQLRVNGAFPQLLMRFGHGPAMPRSLRRPMREVLMADSA